MTGGYVEKSFAPAPADLEAIGAFTRRAFAPEELYVFSAALGAMADRRRRRQNPSRLFV